MYTILHSNRLDRKKKKCTFSYGFSGIIRAFDENNCAVFQLVQSVKLTSSKSIRIVFVSTLACIVYNLVDERVIFETFERGAARNGLQQKTRARDFDVAFAEKLKRRTNPLRWKCEILRVLYLFFLQLSNIENSKNSVAPFTGYRNITERFSVKIRRVFYARR